MTVIERVTFSLTPGTSETAFLEAVEESNKFLIRQPGFISRHVSCLREGHEWMDLVFWEDMTLALQAASGFNDSEHTAGFTKKLDRNTISMAHLELKSQAGV